VSPTLSTRDGEGRRKAIRTAPTDPLTWNPFLGRHGCVRSLAIGKTATQQGTALQPHEWATPSLLRPAPELPAGNSTCHVSVKLRRRHPTSMLPAPTKSSPRRKRAHVLRPVPRVADRNRLIPEWLLGSCPPLENWLPVSPGAATRSATTSAENACAELRVTLRPLQPKLRTRVTPVPKPTAIPVAVPLTTCFRRWWLRVVVVTPCGLDCKLAGDRQ
jgi:hypothetical protein